MSERAFVLRMYPLGIDRVPIARQTNEISIGWGKAGADLLAWRLDRPAFAQVVHSAYYAAAADRRGSGTAAGQLWRFIRVMSPGDLVLIPHIGQLHVAEVVRDVTYDSDPNAEHWAYRRRVTWRTGERGTARRQAGDAIQAAARTRLTCIDVSQLRDDLESLLSGR